MIQSQKYEGPSLCSKRNPPNNGTNTHVTSCPDACNGCEKLRSGRSSRHESGACYILAQVQTLRYNLQRWNEEIIAYDC